MQQAEKKLEDAQKLARSNPDLINKDKLDELQNAHKTAHESKKEADGKIARMTEVIGKNKTEYAQAYRELSNLRSQYDNLMERIVNRMVAERQADYKKSQTVQATGIVACGKLTVDDCKEAALKEAERQAIEQGAVVVVNSITEINNSKLTRDQIRSSVVGKIESRKILAKGFVSDDTAYQIKIEAVVTPGVGRDLLEQMQQTARFEIEQAIGGGV